MGFVFAILKINIGMIPPIHVFNAKVPIHFIMAVVMQNHQIVSLIMIHLVMCAIMDIMLNIQDLHLNAHYVKGLYIKINVWYVRGNLIQLILIVNVIKIINFLS